MKKLIAATAAALMMMTFAGTAANAAYEPTTDTNVQPQPKSGKVEAGKKEKIKVSPGVDGDASQCTGSIVAIYKAGKKVVRERDKVVEGGPVSFNGLVPEGTTKIVFVYQRGKKDPCDKSRSGLKVS